MTLYLFSCFWLMGCDKPNVFCSNIPTLCPGSMAAALSAHQQAEHLKTNSPNRNIRLIWGLCNAVSLESNRRDQIPSYLRIGQTAAPAPRNERYARSNTKRHLQNPSPIQFEAVQSSAPLISLRQPTVGQTDDNRERPGILFVSSGRVCVV